MGRVRTLVCRSESFVPIVGAVPLCETRRHWLSAVIPDGQRGQASGEQASKDHAEIAVADQVSGSPHREWRDNRSDTGEKEQKSRDRSVPCSSEERLVGNECVSPGRSRWSQYQ